MKTSKQTVFYASILLVSLSLVVGSCEKELPEAGSDEKIPVRFLLQQAPYGEGESLTRSSASGIEEEALSVVPLGDNLYLHASLEVAPPEPTRDALTFSGGERIIIAAYEGSSTTATTSAVYEVSSGGSIAPHSSSSALSVPAGTYTFVAYSYNSTSTLTHTAETVLLSPATATDGDFLWGKTTAPVTISGENTNTVSITMARRMSKVNVEVATSPATSNYYITAISNVRVGPGYTATMSLKDGTFSDPDFIAQYVPFGSIPANSTAIASASRLVFTNQTNDTDTTTVTIGSITVNGIPLNNFNLKAVFNKRLEINHNYTIQLEIKKGLRWAGSNIYWDEVGQTLTFAPHGDRSKEKYQGVFFRFGTLVGISPLRGSSSNDWDATSGSGSISYVPSYTDQANNSWSIVRGGSWNTIPATFFKTDYSATNTGAGVDYFGTYTPNYASGDDASYKRGDICRYLSHIGAVSGNYRLPTANELLYGSKIPADATISYTSDNWTSSSPTVNGYWSRIGLCNSPSDYADWSDSHYYAVGTDATGQYDGLITGGNYSGYTTFPASGYRDNLGSGSLSSVGSIGLYWSGSRKPGNAMEGYTLILQNSEIFLRTNVGNQIHSRNGCPVRCLLIEE